MVNDIGKDEILNMFKNKQFNNLWHRMRSGFCFNSINSSRISQELKWMKKNNLISAILVTSDIHLPRSILEFQNNTNHIKITSWPVKTNSNNFINFLKEFLRFSFVRIKYLII